MTSTLITKNSAVAGLAPSAGQLVQGEMAVNVTDKKLYTLDAGGNVVLLASGAEYDVPVVIDANSATPAATVTQTGTGGGISVTTSSSGTGLIVNKSGTGDALRVTNTGTGNSLVVEDDTNPDASPFVINTLGQTVVGNATARTTRVSTTSVIPQFQLNGTSLATSAVGQFSWNSNPYYVFSKSGSGTPGTPAAVASSVQLGSTLFAGDDGTQFTNAARIDGWSDGTVSAGVVPGSIRMSTASSTGVMTERVRINSSGAISIDGDFGSPGEALVSSGSSAPPLWVTQYLSISFVIDGGGVTIGGGIKGDLTIPFSYAIEEWTLLADQSGSIVVDIWSDVYATYPPTVADSITGSAKPTITASNKGRSSTLTGWVTTIAAGDTLRFNVDSCTSITRATLSLKVSRL
jgi:hypothetical protein